MNIFEYINLIVNSPYLILIINTILALAAVLTWLNARKTFLELKESKRAYVAPAEDAGFIKLSAERTDDLAVKVSVKNYGLNPASNLNANLYFITQELSDESQEINNSEYFVRRLNFPFPTFQCINPLPSGATFTIKLTREEMINTKLDNSTNTYSSATTSIDGIILEVDFQDAILNKRMGKKPFYWILSKEGDLLEVNSQIYKIYSELINNFKKIR